MSEFKSVLIEDNLTGLLSSEISFGVQSAGKANYQQFTATSVSNSTMQFNAQVPNQSVVLDRNMLISTTVFFTLKYDATGLNYPSGGSGNVGDPCFQYGYNSAFGPYPLNSLFTTVSSTINNVSVNANTQDILACLLRMNDNPLISETNTRTASLPDFYYNNYADGVGASNNPLGSISQSSYDAVYFGRGALPLTILRVQHFNGSGVYQDSSLLYGGDADETWTVECSVNLIEPFIALSPFTNNANNQEAGMYGINQISMNINIDSKLRRFWRDSRISTSSTATNSSPQNLTDISLGSDASGSSTAFTETKLLVRFVSMTPEQVRRLGSSRNCLPYMEFPRYLSISSQNSSINGVTPASVSSTGVITKPTLASGSLTSSNIQLSVIPDKIIIGVRIPMSEQNASNTDSWLPITKCVILFNSNSGILSSATVSDLYKLSRRNGSSQNFFEFSGSSSNNNVTTATSTSIAYSDLGGVQPIYTTGSLLVLDPVRDFSLDDWLSASSSGAFNFQVQLEVLNTYTFAIKPEIIIITQQSGIFSTTEGVSATEVGILTKEVVLSTRMNEKPESMLMESEFNRLVGGRRHMNGMFNSMAHKLHKKYNTGYNGMAHKGGAMSGGVISGGVVSGGRLGKYIR
jgi:hypothetical protein